MWRRRWDSLRLFTPAGFSHLPGLRLPGPSDASPTKDEMADYLAAYVRWFALPVELAPTVETVGRCGERLHVTCTEGWTWRARGVVLAGGAHGIPHVPVFATISTRTSPSSTPVTAGVPARCRPVPCWWWARAGASDRGCT